MLDLNAVGRHHTTYGFSLLIIKFITQLTSPEAMLQEYVRSFTHDKYVHIYQNAPFWDSVSAESAKL